MGKPEGPVKGKPYTAAMISDELMRIAPQVQSCVMVAVTKDGGIFMMRTPIGFVHASMVAALINNDLNRKTDAYISGQPAQGSDH